MTWTSSSSPTDEILREIPRLKEKLNLNVELASPSDFIPVPEGWQDRSPLIREEGKLSFHHFSIESELYRFPAIDPASFRKAVMELFSS